MKTEDNIYVLDLHFLDATHVIASFLMESDDGLILVETGPETTFESLKKAISDAGFDWKDVKHVLLTHIHFDHAGAAWRLARNGAKIYVHPVGLPHLHNPEKLWNSAKRIYGDDMDRLWGKMEPIDENLLIAADDGNILRIGGLAFEVMYTPGHAIHHNAYRLNDIIFTGDVAGCKVNNGPVVPPCPPPDINVGAWKRSIQRLRNSGPARLYLTHFGPLSDVQEHLSDLEVILDDWAAWVRPYYDAGDKAPAEITPKFVAYTQNQLRGRGVSEEDIQRYEKANPSFMSVTGLLRYWKLKEQGRME